MATAPVLYWYQLDVGTYAPLYYKQLDDTVRQLCIENGVTQPVANWYSLTTGTLVSTWAAQIDTAVRALCVLFSISPPSEQVYNLTYGQLEPKYSADLDSVVRQLCSGVGSVPQITSNGGGSTAIIDITTSDTAVTTVTATGSAPITFTKSGTDSSLFTLNSSTGVLALITTEPAAAYSVTVTATNSFGHNDQVITVNVSASAFTPGDIPNLTRGWDFNDVTGSNITTVPPAWGTSVALTLGGTSGSPDVLDDFSPNLKNMLDTTSSNNEVGTFTSTGAMSAFTFFCVLAPKTAVAVPLIGGPSTAYIQFNAASGHLSATQVKTNTSSAGIFNFPTSDSYLWPGGCYLVVITFDGTTGTFTYRINGVSNTQVRGASSCTFDRLFRQAATTTYGSGMWAIAGIYSRVLTAGEINQLETGLSAYKANTIYLSQTGDDTTGFGFSVTTPRKSVTTAQAFGGIAQRTGISLKPGDAWINEPITLAQDNFIVETWTPRQLAYLVGVGASSGWVDAGGGLWTKSSITAQPGAIWHVKSTPTTISAPGSVGATADFNGIVKLISAATSSDYTFQWDDPTDTVTARFTSGVDPNVDDIRIASGTVTKGWATSAAGQIGNDISIRYFTGEGVRPTGINVITNFCDLSWNLGDGGDGNSAGLTTYQDGYAHGNGLSLGLAAQGVDGTSAHATAQLAVLRNDIRGNRLGGVRCEQYVSVTSAGNYIEGNGNDWMVLQQGAGAGPATNTITDDTIVVTDYSLAGFGLEIQSGVTSDVTTTVTNTAFINNSSTNPLPRAINILGGTFVDGGGNTHLRFTALSN